jgi:hypothetical protein
MMPASARRAAPSTQIPRATSAPLATFELPDVLARTDRVRFLLNQNLPHGVRQFIAGKLGLRRESITRQLDPQRTERLTEDVAILGQLWLERTEGMQSVAEEVKELRFAGLRTVVLMLPCDRETWDFTVNVRTGEIKP